MELTWRSGTDQRVQRPRPYTTATTATMTTPPHHRGLLRRPCYGLVVLEARRRLGHRRGKGCSPPWASVQSCGSPLGPTFDRKAILFSAPRHVDAHTLGAIDWLRSDCPGDGEQPSQTHKVGVWEINAPILTAARRHQIHHGSVSTRKDGVSQQSSCHGNCRSAKKEGIYV